MTVDRGASCRSMLNLDLSPANIITLKVDIPGILGRAVWPRAWGRVVQKASNPSARVPVPKALESLCRDNGVLLLWRWDSERFRIAMLQESAYPAIIEIVDQLRLVIVVLDELRVGDAAVAIRPVAQELEDKILNLGPGLEDHAPQPLAVLARVAYARAPLADRPVVGTLHPRALADAALWEGVVARLVLRVAAVASARRLALL